MRYIPSVSTTPFEASDGTFLSQGYDYLQECYALAPDPNWIESLERLRKAAGELKSDDEGTVQTELNGFPFRVHATGAKGGFKWRLENDDVLIFVADPKREWTISVRYLAAGLWEHGSKALRNMVFEALRPYTRQVQGDCIRVTRFDWCFDFYSPRFSTEFHPNMSGRTVAHSSTKTHELHKCGTYYRGPRGETLTIGSKAGLEVQVYDKGREIIEKSGKTWLVPIWVKALNGEVPWGAKLRDIWRLELRFSADFLKERNVRRPHEIEANLSALISEALFTRRLTVEKDGDINRARWPLHWMWSEAYRQRGCGEMVPIGRKVTGRRNELRDAAVSQISGSIRSATVLAFGKYIPEHAEAMLHEAKERIEKDPAHDKKELEAQSRYSTVDEAR